jgi:RNA 2',3'-cyclic 3'-phosphodiesterase
MVEAFMRLFVGIPLAEVVSTELAAMVARLKRGDDGMRWSAPESWHITLQFLGNTTDEKYACVAEALRKVKAPPVSVQITEPGIFERAGVFHAGVEVTKQLAELQRRVTAANQPCGFEGEARPYHPHITLARVKTGVEDRRNLLEGLKKRAVLKVRLPGFVAERFALFESILGAGGSKYQIREWFPLN